jgi:hypothetical protein
MPIQLKLNIKTHLVNALLRPVKPFATAPEHLKCYDSRSSDMIVCALIQVEGILNICCEFRPFKNPKSRVIKLGTYTVNVLCQF